MQPLKPTAIRLALLAGLALGVFSAPLPVQAAKNPNSKLVMYLVPYSNRNTCTTGRLAGPSGMVTKGDLFPAKYTAYVLIVDGTPGVGIAGCQFGVAYDDTTKKGVDILDWQECSLFNFPTQGWPVQSGTGNMLTWNQEEDCDSTGIRVVGYFTVVAYTPGRLSIIANPAYKTAAVASCGVSPSSKNIDVIDVIPQENLGFVDFGGGPGYNPWDPKQNLLKFRDPGRFKPILRTPESRPAKTGER